MKIQLIYPAEHTFIFNLDSAESTPEGIAAALELVFAQFNHGSSAECELFINSRKRSMCVGDVVIINDERAFRCENVGWSQMTLEDVAKYENAVANHPDTRFHGAWFGMNSVLRGG